MVNIVTCVKNARDPNDIVVDESGAVDLDGIQTKMSDYDDRAIEAAVKIKEEYGGSITALSVGDDEAKHTLRTALAFGLDEGILLEESEFRGDNPAVTAHVIAEVIRELGDVDIVLCGAMSEDLYTKQVPARISTQLDVPLFANAIDLRYEGGDTLEVRQDLEEEIRSVEGSLPAVVAVRREINEPRYVSRREILQVPRDAMKVWTLSDLGIDEDVSDVACSRTVALRGMSSERKNVVLEGDPDTAVANLWESLADEGVVK